MNSNTGIKGRDMPAVDNPDYDPPTRPTETGYGASVDDIRRGYLAETPPGDNPDVGDVQPAGPQGFLYRGRLAIDR